MINVLLYVVVRHSTAVLRIRLSCMNDNWSYRSLPLKQDTRSFPDDPQSGHSRATVDVVPEPVPKSIFNTRSTGTALLPSSRVPRRLQDIIDNAQAIFSYTEGMDEAAFQENRMVHDAVERCLERICEAASKLGDMAVHLMPDQPWHKIRAFGKTFFGMSTTPSSTTACLTLWRRLSRAFAPPVNGAAQYSETR